MIDRFNDRFRDFFYQGNSKNSKTVIRKIVLGLIVFTALMVILLADFVPSRISLKAGQVSDRDIVSPRTVSFVDEVKSRKLEIEMLAGVAKVYDLDTGIIGKSEETAKNIFLAAATVLDNPVLNTPAVRKDKLKDYLSSVLSPVLADNTLLALATLDKNQLEQADKAVKLLLGRFFQRGIKEGDLEFVMKTVEIEVEGLNLSTEAELVVTGIVQKLLQPNLNLNLKETDKRRKAALASMEPVRQTVKKGQTLVRRGDVLTDEQIKTLEETGLSTNHINEIRVFGLAMFVLAIMLVMMGYIYRFSPAVFENDKNLILIGLILLLTMVFSKASHYVSPFLAPVAVGALLTAVLIDMRVGILMGMTVALLFGVSIEQDVRSIAVAITGNLAGVYSVSKFVHGYSFTRTGIVIAFVNVIIIFSTGLLAQVELTEIFIQCMWGIIGGIAAAVIATGLLPYLENVFRITTSLSLLDVIKPNHPLLQQLLLTAPGTYHHSLLVGNLSETAAELVGADPIIVRSGAFYHDIGKIRRPYFFIENQVPDDNPHDKIAPNLSRIIVTSHVKDGVDLCREHHIPQVITDIVQQHHGTMLVSYFYKRATANEHGECIEETDFRYEGPRPQSKEAALIMLADACEAAVRSISRPNVNRIESTVRKIIQERLLDGQLNDCNLTLKDLNTIGDVYIRLLSGTFHNRIEYTDVKDLERGNGKNGSYNKQHAGKDSDNTTDGTSDSVGIKHSS